MSNRPFLEGQLALASRKTGLTLSFDWFGRRLRVIEVEPGHPDRICRAVSSIMSVDEMAEWLDGFLIGFEEGRRGVDSGDV